MDPRIKIRRATRKDVKEWVRLRKAVYQMLPTETDETYKQEILDMLSQENRWAAFVAEGPGNKLVGLVEASLRDYAEKCKTSPVGYIEGWYVEPEHRRSGTGRALVAAAERWAISKGCSEMASDALIENKLSHRAHKALGYEEVERHVCFRKELCPLERRAARRSPATSRGLAP